MYDAIVNTIRSVEDEAPRARALVLLTDGVDTASVHNAQDAATAAAALDIPVYALGVDDFTERPRTFDHTLVDENATVKLAELARRTGGTATEANSVAQLSIATRGILTELHHQVHARVRGRHAGRLASADGARAQRPRGRAIPRRLPRSLTLRRSHAFGHFASRAGAVICATTALLSAHPHRRVLLTGPPVRPAILEDPSRGGCCGCQTRRRARDRAHPRGRRHLGGRPGRHGAARRPRAAGLVQLDARAAGRRRPAGDRARRRPRSVPRGAADRALAGRRAAQGQGRLGGSRASIIRPTSTAALWGKVQEVRDAILDFKRSRKPIIAYLEYGGEQEFYLASACDKVFLMPTASLDLTGMASYELFLRGTLDKIGAYPDALHIGDYKTASNTFTEHTLHAGASRDGRVAQHRSLRAAGSRPRRRPAQVGAARCAR